MTNHIKRIEIEVRDNNVITVEVEDGDLESFYCWLILKQVSEIKADFEIRVEYVPEVKVIAQQQLDFKGTPMGINLLKPRVPEFVELCQSIIDLQNGGETLTTETLMGRIKELVEKIG